MHADAVIVAAGAGKRFGSKLPKQFLTVAGKPVLAWSLAVFQQHPAVDTIVVVGPRAWLSYIATEIVDAFAFNKVSRIVAGGERRQDSVLAGVLALENENTPVLVHDAARPVISSALIDRVLAGLEGADACVPGIPVADTVKQVEGEWVAQTLQRSLLRLIQTPQAFYKARLVQALREANARGLEVTDEASLIEQFQGRVRCVPGDPLNLKITAQLDLKLVEQILEEHHT